MSRTVDANMHKYRYVVHANLKFRGFCFAPRRFADFPQDMHSVRIASLHSFRVPKDLKAK
jgi:hypothetical protein